MLIERGKVAGFKSKLQGYSDKLRKKALDGWSDIERWEIDVVGEDSKFFQMIRANPVREDEAKAKKTKEG